VKKIVEACVSSRAEDTDSIYSCPSLPANAVYDYIRRKVDINKLLHIILILAGDRKAKFIFLDSEYIRHGQCDGLRFV